MAGGSSQTIGFRYFMGLHMAICHGPVDTLHNVYVGKRLVPVPSGQLPLSVNGTALLQGRELFGGDEKEGGIYGLLDVEFGESTQLQNDYLISQFGASNTPAFRGVTCGVFRVSRTGFRPELESSSDGGYVAAMSPYPKPWAFEVTNIPGGSFNPTKQIIGGGANGGHIIYDCLTNSDWGLGLSAVDIDTVSFTAATDTLFDEVFGLSMIYAQQSTMEDFLREIMDHINAVLYVSRETGKFVLTLIRDDFDPGILEVFDENNISSLISFERPAFAEMVNEITIKYKKQGQFVDSSITVHDLASIQAQGGVVSDSVNFNGVDTDDIAARIAQRELKQKSTPLARVKFSANREAWNVNPGDVIKLSWAVYGISEVIIRVVAVDYGTLTDGDVIIDGVEDIFGLPASSYFKPQDTSWTDQVGPPVASPSTRVIELPHFVIETTFAEEQLNALLDETSILQAVAEFPSVATFNLKLATRIGANAFVEVANGEFSSTCQLVGALDRQTTTSISIKNFSGSSGQIVIGGYAYLNGEVLRVDSVDLTNDLLDVGRGYLDSLPQSHTTDDIIYFADDNNSVDPTLYTDSDVVDAKVLPQTSQGTLDEADAVTDTLIMVGRRLKPYNASQIKIAATYFPAVLVDELSISVTWEHQDRTQQLTTNGTDWYNTALGAPELGTTYTVRYYDDDGASLLFTDSGLTGKQSSYTPTTAIGVAINIRVELETVRSGIISLQLFSHVLSYTKPLGVRALENSVDIRVLESGDRRTLEG